MRKYTKIPADIIKQIKEGIIAGKTYSVLAEEHGIAVITVYQIDRGGAHGDIEPKTPNQIKWDKRWAERAKYKRQPIYPHSVVLQESPAFIPIHSIEDLEETLNLLKEAGADKFITSIAVSGEGKAIAKEILETRIAKHRSKAAQLKWEIAKCDLMISAIENKNLDILPQELKEELERDIAEIRKGNLSEN